MTTPALQLYDPRNGDLSLAVSAVEDGPDLAQPQRFNWFSVYWIEQGQGAFWADLACHDFFPGCLLFFVPYQALRVLSTTPLRGLVLQFHANFLCIETHHEEVGCNGVLFNDVYGIPLVRLAPPHDVELRGLVEKMRQEIRDGGLAHPEALLAYLKLFLIKATRLKREQQDLTGQSPARKPAVLEQLRQLIEAHYKTHHSPAYYADRLHVTAKALGKVVKTHLHKTLTELIRERILKQAKWKLLHTLEPIKQIAAEVGFADELYFSRLFKQATGCAPVFFREYETAIRNGSNLSMR